MGGGAEPQEILLSIEGVTPGNTAKAVAGAPDKAVGAVGAVAGAPGNGAEAGTRAAVDEWKNTTVSIAYAFGSSAVLDRALSVNIADDTGMRIHTGMEYPSDGVTPASFVGYHPAKAPNGQGIIGYDLSSGDLDVMLSNKLEGTQAVPISDPMKFEHQLTRFTFIMKCRAGESYPETVHGLRAIANSATKLMTYININLNNGGMNFSFPGQITSNIPDGAVVPESTAQDDVLTFNLMLQPDVPVTFEVITLTDVKQIIIPPGTNTLWDALLADGGEAGKQYTVRLWFSGEGILAGGISVTPWSNVVTAYTGGGTWW
jgi:hypothetical protein